MWCTRWFLPLLLLPLPTAPPYFLLLFLVALTMNARPCFYCIVLLSAIFVSSCYWQPFPIDSHLSTPWSPNATTFSEALNASMSSVQVPYPSTIRAVDRCWCDFTSGNFFEPFNVIRWEYMSVERLKSDLLRRKAVDDALALENERDKRVDAEATSRPAADMPQTLPPKPTTGPNSDSKAGIFSILRSAVRTARSKPLHGFSSQNETVPELRQSPPKGLPLLRKEYDLGPYGFDVVVDFGWSRRSS